MSKSIEKDADFEYENGAGRWLATLEEYLEMGDVREKHVLKKLRKFKKNLDDGE